MKFDVQILETMFNIVLKFHDQNLYVVEVITIPDIILKRHAAYIFIERSNNYYILYYIMLLRLHNTYAVLPDTAFTATIIVTCSSLRAECAHVGCYLTHVVNLYRLVAHLSEPAMCLCSKPHCSAPT